MDCHINEIFEHHFEALKNYCWRILFTCDTSTSEACDPGLYDNVVVSELALITLIPSSPDQSEISIYIINQSEISVYK